MRRRKSAENLEGIKKIGIYSWSIIGLLILLSLFFYLLYRIRIAIMPLILAMGIAYLLSPLVFWMTKKLKKGLAIFLSYLILTGLLFVLFFFTIPMIVDQFQIFVVKLPSYIQNLTEIINRFITEGAIIRNIENLSGRDVLPLDTNAITNYIINTLGLTNTNFFQTATAFTRSAVNIIITIFIGPLIGIYILKDANRLREVFLKVIPFKFRRDISSIIDKINIVGGRYIRGQILISIIIGILCTLVLFLLKVDFAVLLGFTAGALNLIPFLGPIIGAIPAALAALFISPLKALLVILLFVGVQQLDNYFISPNVMKYQVGVHPAIVIFVLIAGGALLGPLGLLLAVPTTAIIQAILKYYFFEKKKSG
jgi:predicted PurR-regulated permease PerM